jgi:hypothetical protein
MLARDIPYRATGSAHLLVQFLVDPIFIPSELLDVLRPLEIAHGDATGVGENVRNDQDAPLVQDLAGFGRCGPISPFNNNARLDVGGIVLSTTDSIRL